MNQHKASEWTKKKKTFSCSCWGSCGWLISSHNYDRSWWSHQVNTSLWRTAICDCKLMVNSCMFCVNNNKKKWVNECTGEQMNEWMNEWASEWVNELLNKKEGKRYWQHLPLSSPVYGACLENKMRLCWVTIHKTLPFMDFY